MYHCVYMYHCVCVCVWFPPNPTLILKLTLAAFLGFLNTCVDLETLKNEKFIFAAHAYKLLSSEQKKKKVSWDFYLYTSPVCYINNLATCSSFFCPSIWEILLNWTEHERTMFHTSREVEIFNKTLLYFHSNETSGIHSAFCLHGYFLCHSLLKFLSWLMFWFFSYH